MRSHCQTRHFRYIPLFHLLDNLFMALNVLWKWVAQIHMTCVGSVHPQVLPTEIWSVKLSVKYFQPHSSHVLFVTALAQLSSVNVLVKNNGTKSGVFSNFTGFFFKSIKKICPRGSDRQGERGGKFTLDRPVPFPVFKKKKLYCPARLISEKIKLREGINTQYVPVRQNTKGKRSGRGIKVCLL